MLPFVYVVNLLYKDNPTDPALHFESMALKKNFFSHQNSAGHSFSMGMILLPREQKLVLEVPAQNY